MDMMGYEMETVFLTEKEVAQAIKFSVPTLRRWRAENAGPKWVKVGFNVRYTPEDVRAWQVGLVKAQEVAAVSRLQLGNCSLML